MRTISWSLRSFGANSIQFSFQEWCSLVWAFHHFVRWYSLFCFSRSFFYVIFYMMRCLMNWTAERIFDYVVLIMDTHDLSMSVDKVKQRTTSNILMQWKICVRLQLTFASVWLGFAIYTVFFLFTLHIIYIFSKETPCHFHWVWAQNQHSNAIINDAIKINIDRKCAHCTAHVLTLGCQLNRKIKLFLAYDTSTQSYVHAFTWSPQLIIHSHISWLRIYITTKPKLIQPIRSLWHQLRILFCFHFIYCSS